MSDLGAIFHVKKDGVQYDANAYTTLDECPEPNLKVMYKGQQGYVKLEAKGEGDIPCYVKTKAGNTYQVKKEAVSAPTGSTNVGDGDTFTVPSGVKVIRAFFSKYEHDETSNSQYTYIGVTPGKTYKLKCYVFIIFEEGDPNRENTDGIYLGTTDESQKDHTWFQRTPADDIQDTSSWRGFALNWSPEINKMTPTYTDY